MVRLESDETINFAASHHIQTWLKMRHTADEVEVKAKGNLAEHRHAGDASIEKSRGGKDKDTEDVDWLIILSDEHGLGAAMSIEFGREEGTTSSWGPSQATNILHDAASLKGRGKGRVKRSDRGRKGPNARRRGK